MPRTPRNTDLTLVSEWQDGEVRRLSDYLAAEEPLEILVDGRPLTVTMRTPGEDFELAAGFLLTEGLIERREQITGLNQVRPNTVNLSLEGVLLDRERMQRNFFAASSCGICGKASIEAVRVNGLSEPDPDLRLEREVLYTLPEKLRAEQTVFGRTGGLHAAGLFTAEGKLVVLREDIGRHNAVDKVIGWALLDRRLPLAGHVLMVSGRGGFEIVQKTLAGGAPVLASVSAPSSLAVQLARELDLTLVGFLRERRFVVYSGEQRLL